MRPTSKKSRKTQLKLLNSKGFNFKTARSILRHKSTIKYNKNNEHRNRKPKNSTRIDFKQKKI